MLILIFASRFSFSLFSLSVSLCRTSTQSKCWFLDCFCLIRKRLNNITLYIYIYEFKADCKLLLLRLCCVLLLLLLTFSLIFFIAIFSFALFAVCIVCTAQFRYLCHTHTLSPFIVSAFLMDLHFRQRIISTSRLWHTVVGMMCGELRVYDYIIIKHTFCSLFLCTANHLFRI